MNILDYADYDSKMCRKTYPARISFAKRMDFDYFSEMIHKKHIDEDLGVVSISNWINNNNEDVVLVSPSSIDYTLKVMGVFRYKNGNKVTRRLKEDRLCTACGQSAKAPGNKFLCNRCYSNNTEPMKGIA